MTTNESFNLAALFPFLAILTPLALFWTQVKALLVKIMNIFVVSVEAQGHTAYAINYNITKYYKRYSMGSYQYVGQHFYVNKVNRRIAVVLEQLSRIPQLVRARNRFFILKNSLHKDSDSVLVDKLHFYYLRGTFDHEAFLIESMDRYNASMSPTENSNRFAISYKKGYGKRTMISASMEKAGDEAGRAPRAARNAEDNSDQLVAQTNRILGLESKDIGYPATNGELKSYVFCDQANHLLAECRRWRDSEKWYRSRGILWRRGALLMGKSGSGKTSLIRTICKILDLPLYIFDLASMSNAEMIDAWESIQTNSPCAVLFDDIEKVFENGINVIGEDGGGLSYDCFLSCLSGAKPAEGVLTFCTTNDASKLNDTLGVSTNGVASRPGRIDTIIEINDMEEINRRQLAQNILSDFPEGLETIVMEGKGMTAAQFQNHCTTIALERYWDAQTT